MVGFPWEPPKETVTSVTMLYKDNQPNNDTEWSDEISSKL